MNINSTIPAKERGVPNTRLFHNALFTMVYKGHAANIKETTQIKKKTRKQKRNHANKTKPRKQKRKQGTHAKSHSSSQSPCEFLVLCR